MPTYSIHVASITGSRHSPKVSPGSNNPCIQLTSYRLYGEDIPSNISGAASVVGQVGGDTTLADYTPPQFNSRSRAAIDSYVNDSADTTTGISSAICYMNNVVTHNGILFGTRYYPIAIGAEFIRVGVLNGSLNHTGMYSEDAVVPARRVRRRTTKPGYQPGFGNTIASYMKTGSGAYSFIAPSFDNDIYWTDVTAWGNGHIQSNVWNICLYRAPGVRRGVIGSGFADIR